MLHSVKDFLVAKIILLSLTLVSSEKLILTSFIQSNETVEGKSASLVKDLKKFGLPFDIISYSGFIRVEEECESDLFFWFIPAMHANSQGNPLILWHGGGPGSSGLSGMFREHGPFFTDKDGDLTPREWAWSLKRNVIYLDSPVGTGFSTTKEEEEKKGCIVKSAERTGKHVYEFLSQFYKLFPEFRKNELFLLSGSYGGKFLPAIAYEIHSENKKKASRFKMPLKGVLIASGFMDPESQLSYGDFYYHQGLISISEREYFRGVEAAGRAEISKGNWSGVFDLIEPLIIGENENGSNKPSKLKEITGIPFPLNMGVDQTPGTSDYLGYPAFLNRPEVKETLHIGNDANYSKSSEKVYQNFKDDIYKSVKYSIWNRLTAFAHLRTHSRSLQADSFKTTFTQIGQPVPKLSWSQVICDTDGRKPLIEELLDTGLYRFLFIGSQLDLIVPHSTVSNFVTSISWRGEEAFRSAPTEKLTFRGNAIGYLKSCNNGLDYLFLRNSGHLWTRDNPDRSFKVMMDFTSGSNKGGFEAM